MTAYITKATTLVHHRTQAEAKRHLGLRTPVPLRSLSLTLLLFGLCLAPAQASALIDHPKSDSILRSTSPPLGASMLYAGLRTLPLIAIGTGYTLYNTEIRSLRHAHTPYFRHHYDDYLQFAPLAAQLSMNLIGLEGSSTSRSQILLGNAIAYGGMLGLVHLGKTTTRVLRPDGSAYNSFPSGHTAMAFTSATLLHLEYGGRYPWLSALGYASASAVGLGRILNNRHWVGDVVTGAALGYACGIFGYWLSDKVLGAERKTDMLTNTLLPNRSLRLYLPIRHSPPRQRGSAEASQIYSSTALGIGLQWTYSPRGYYIQGEFAPTVHHINWENSQQDYRSLTFTAGWGREFPLWPEHIYLSIGSHIQVGLPLSTPQSLIIREDESTYLIPNLSISPRWQMNSRLGLSLDISGGYRLGTSTEASKKSQLTNSHWGLAHLFGSPYSPLHLITLYYTK